MQDLAGFVRELVQRPEVESVVLASPDGLAIDHATRGDGDPEAIAALAATAVRAAGQLAAAAGSGAVRTAVIETDERLLVLAGAGAEGWLVVAARPGARVGELLFELRRRRADLVALL